MDRRNLMFSFAAATLPLLASSRQPAQAETQGQPSAPACTGEGCKPITAGAYVAGTSQIGYVSLVLSNIAFDKSTNAAVRYFALSEIYEQQAFAKVLSQSLTPPAPQLTATEKATINALYAASPDLFDAVYVNAEILGHRELLVFQERLLSTSSDPKQDLVQVALLAQSNIRQHEILLGELVRTV